MDCPVSSLDVYTDRSTAAYIAQLSLKLGEPIPDLLTRIVETGLAEQIQKN
jgi:hypothetical protein